MKEKKLSHDFAFSRTLTAMLIICTLFAVSATVIFEFTSLPVWLKILFTVGMIVAALLAMGFCLYCIDKAIDKRVKNGSMIDTGMPGSM